MNTRRQVICRVKRKIRIERNIAISVENKFIRRDYDENVHRKIR